MLSLNEIVQYCSGLFARQETLIEDQLKSEIIKGLGLSVGDVVLAVGLDEKEPVAAYSDNEVLLRMNGRFFPPQKANGKEIGFTVADWKERLSRGLDQVTKNHKVDDSGFVPLKFTLFVSGIKLPKPVKK